MSDRITPLQDLQQRQGARFVSFGGWSLPVSYAGILDEYWAVRRHAGLFDVSHMGRFLFEGADAGRRLDALLTQSVSDLAVGQGRYGLMCLPDGGILDDVICFRLASERYLLVVNGAPREKDWSWIQSRLGETTGLSTQDTTLGSAMAALQGPKSLEVLDRALKAKGLEDVASRVGALKRFQILQAKAAEPLPLLISRTGYTGEDGVEVYGPPQVLRELWSEFVEQGAQPAGLGARDVLRLEMGYLLYGQDATEENHPYEARLGWTVRGEKSVDFIGKEALAGKKGISPKQTLVGLRLAAGGIPRTGFEVRQAGQTAGRVTSGGYSPWLKAPIALAYYDGFEKSQWGIPVEVIVRGKAQQATIIKPPFIDRSKPPKA